MFCFRLEFCKIVSLFYNQIFDFDFLLFLFHKIWFVSFSEFCKIVSYFFFLYYTSAMEANYCKREVYMLNL